MYKIIQVHMTCMIKRHGSNDPKHGRLSIPIIKAGKESETVD